MSLLLLPVIALAAVVSAVALAGHGFQTLSRHGPRRTDPAPALRALAAFTGAMALALYAWGVLHLAGTVLEAEDGGAGSAPLLPCRLPDRQEEVPHVVDYSVDYVPLRFVCETGGGRDDYATDDVPRYVNPGVVGLALTAAVCVVAAGYAAELRARSEARRGDPPSAGTV